MCGLQSAAAQQLSALLRLGHILRLQSLLDVLHKFIMLNARPSGYLLSGAAGLVFTERALEALPAAALPGGEGAAASAKKPTSTDVTRTVDHTASHPARSPPAC